MVSYVVRLYLATLHTTRMAATKTTYLSVLISRRTPKMGVAEAATTNTSYLSVLKGRRAPIMGVAQLLRCAGDKELRKLTEPEIKQENGEYVDDRATGPKNPVGEGDVKANQAVIPRNVLSAMIGETGRSVHFGKPAVVGKPEDFSDVEKEKIKYYWHGILDLNESRYATLCREVTYFGGRQ